MIKKTPKYSHVCIYSMPTNNHRNRIFWNSKSRGRLKRAPNSEGGLVHSDIYRKCDFEYRYKAFRFARLHAAWAAPRLPPTRWASEICVEFLETPHLLRRHRLCVRIGVPVRAARISALRTVGTRVLVASCA